MLTRHFFLQHMSLCDTLYKLVSSRVATGVKRSMFVTTMCAEATSDLLCLLLEKGLNEGDAHAPHAHACVQNLLAAASTWEKLSLGCPPRGRGSRAARMLLC